MNIINTALSVVIILVLIAISYSDFRFRRIPNKLVVAVAILSICYSLFANHSIQILFPLIVLIIGMIISPWNVIGAGDIKLIVALLFSLASSENAIFLIMTALCGLPLSAGILLYNQLANEKIKTVPYGIAIAAGYVMTLIVS